MSFQMILQISFLYGFLNLSYGYGINPFPAFFFFLWLMKEGLQNTRPQPQVIIPSAAYSGAIISFVLCPSELLKVSELASPYMTLLFPILYL